MEKAFNLLEDTKRKTIYIILLLVLFVGMVLLGILGLFDIVIHDLDLSLYLIGLGGLSCLVAYSSLKQVITHNKKIDEIYGLMNSEISKAKEVLSDYINTLRNKLEKSKSMHNSDRGTVSNRMHHSYRKDKLQQKYGSIIYVLDEVLTCLEKTDC